ncbi:hypothetical protein M0804_010627 [Polistes exclamans]|nr:hypothetical protein M0804_010627 [Polistes exclamans]
MYNEIYTEIKKPPTRRQLKGSRFDFGPLSQEGPPLHSDFYESPEFRDLLKNLEDLLLLVERHLSEEWLLDMNDDKIKRP